MKYYYIYYKCEILGWRPANTVSGWVSTGKVEQHAQDVINVHPLQWQLDTNKEYDKEILTTFGTKTRERYTVISWQELSQEEFVKFEGQF